MALRESVRAERDIVSQALIPSTQG